MIESRTIVSRVHRVWAIAVALYFGGLLVLAAYVGIPWLFGVHDRDMADLIAVLLIPIAGSLLWLGIVWFNRRGCVRELRYDAHGVRLNRPYGITDSFAWNDVREVRYHSNDDGEFFIVVGDKPIQACSHGFKADDWRAFYRTVLFKLGSDVDYRDLSVEFDIKQAKRLGRISLSAILIGVVSTLALFAWDTENGAGWIVLFGTILLVVGLGSATPDTGTNRLPIAITLGFFFRKLIAAIPIGLIVLIVNPPAEFKQPDFQVAWVYYASNACFFGGMAVALICYGGFSPMAHIRGPKQGFLRYHKAVVALALAISVVGFIFKCSNENWDNTKTTESTLPAHQPTRLDIDALEQ